MATLAQLLEALTPPALAVDASERVAGCNAAARRLFGEDPTGAHFSRVLRNPGLVEGIERSLAGDAPRAALRWRPPGTQDSHEVTFGALGQGAERHALLLFTDRSEAEQAEAMRRDFVANVSHELRTPLTTLMGFIETLRGPARDDAPARDRFLGIMEAEAGRMKRLVDDLLSLSRVEENERLRPTDPVDLAEIARSVRAGLAPMAERAGVTLAEVTAEAAPVVPGDADQLRQVLTNLVENAIKYGGAGARVTLRVERRDHDADLRGPAAALIVTDTGPGMDPLHIPRLTERFYRVDTHRSRDKGGTGLGLAIVKHIVSRHRGRLRITSAPGEGSRFAVILPLTAPETPPAGPLS